MKKSFNVTYNLRTVGKPVGLVNGTLFIPATDAFAAMLKAVDIIADSEDIHEAEWAALNFDVQPGEYYL